MYLKKDSVAFRKAYNQNTFPLILSSKQNKDQSYKLRNAETDVSKNLLLNSS